MRRDAKIFLGVVISVGTLAISLVAAGVWWLKDAMKPSPQPPIEDIAPRVTATEPAPGRQRLSLRWTIAPAPRERCFASIDAQVKVTRPDGTPAIGADVIALWGTDYAERRQVRDTFSTSLSAWTCRAGTMHVFASLQGVGAAKVPCRYVAQMGSTNHGPFAGFECHGALDPNLELDLPPPPACPPGGLTEVVQLFAPGACLGLDALFFSHLPSPMIHVSTTTYEDFRPWQMEDDIAARFEIPLLQTAEAMEVELGARHARVGERFSELLQRLEAALGPPELALPSRADCGARGSTAGWNYSRVGVGSARLTATLTDCDPAKAVAFKLSLRTAPARSQ